MTELSKMRIYKPLGSVDDADCVIGHSFGTSIDPNSVNAQLGGQVLSYAQGRPIIADRTLVDAMPHGDTLVDHVVEGEVTDIKARGVGTWGTLVEARQFMEEEGLNAPLMIAQAYHVARVVRQAAKLGIASVIPESLPKEFDKNSDQIWTRSPFLWVPFNALGSLLLKSRGQL